ncbi:MAG: iron chelate uptake ABC transporter family permease subunit [Thermomicrobiales bacterium]
MAVVVSPTRGQISAAIPPFARLRPLVIAGLLLLAAALLGIVSGKAPLDAGEVVRMIAHRAGLAAPVSWPLSHEAILFDIRMPRVALAALTGAALGMAGATYQGLFRNPLADPYLLGIASGASLGVVIAFVLPLPALIPRLGAVQALAFAGAIIAVTAVYGLARTGATAPTGTLLLAGIALGSLANAIATYLMYRHGEQLLVIYGWLLGGFNTATWQEVRLAALALAASGVVMTIGGRTLNLLQFGEEQAATLGVRVERSKLILVAAASLATAAAVAAGGLIGFVGLVVPHVTRLLFGPDQRQLLPLAALLGAAFLITADTAARSLPGTSELPVGVVTAVIGAPFFLYLLRRQKRVPTW